jgi:hypothetical protein
LLIFAIAVNVSIIAGYLARNCTERDRERKYGLLAI